MLFLKVFNVGDNFDSRLSQFHIVAHLYEKHFLLFADLKQYSNSHPIMKIYIQIIFEFT